MKDPTKALLDTAKSFLGVHEEGGNNHGAMVEEFQRAVDGKAAGEPWCMCFVQYCIREAERLSIVHSRIYRSESCLDVWEKSPANMRLTKPEPGAIAIWNRVGTRQGHTGIVVAIRSPEVYITIEGNTTNGQEIEREGAGVWLKYRSVRATRLFRPMGWIRPFANPDAAFPPAT